MEKHLPPLHHLYQILFHHFNIVILFNTFYPARKDYLILYLKATLHIMTGWMNFVRLFKSIHPKLLIYLHTISTLNIFHQLSLNDLYLISHICIYTALLFAKLFTQHLSNINQIQIFHNVQSFAILQFFQIKRANFQIRFLIQACMTTQR